MSRLNKAIFTLISCTILSGFGKPEHSKVNVTVVKKHNDLVVTFKVEMNPGIVVTPEGPWEVRIQDPSELNLKPVNKGDFVSKKFDQSIPGFEVKTAVPKSRQGKFSWKLRSFVCTADKVKCYPELHKGETDWSI